MTAIDLKNPNLQFSIDTTADFSSDPTTNTAGNTSLDTATAQIIADSPTSLSPDYAMFVQYSDINFPVENRTPAHELEVPNQPSEAELANVVEALTTDLHREIQPKGGKIALENAAQYVSDLQGAALTLRMVNEKRTGMAAVLLTLNDEVEHIQTTGEIAPERVEKVNKYAAELAQCRDVVRLELAGISTFLANKLAVREEIQRQYAAAVETALSVGNRLKSTFESVVENVTKFIDGEKRTQQATEALLATGEVKVVDRKFTVQAPSFPALTSQEFAIGVESNQAPEIAKIAPVANDTVKTGAAASTALSAEKTAAPAAAFSTSASPSTPTAPAAPAAPAAELKLSSAGATTKSKEEESRSPSALVSTDKQSSANQEATSTTGATKNATGSLTNRVASKSSGLNDNRGLNLDQDKSAESKGNGQGTSAAKNETDTTGNRNTIRPFADDERSAKSSLHLPDADDDGLDLDDGADHEELSLGKGLDGDEQLKLDGDLDEDWELEIPQEDPVAELTAQLREAAARDNMEYVACRDMARRAELELLSLVDRHQELSQKTGVSAWVNKRALARLDDDIDQMTQEINYQKDRESEILKSIYDRAKFTDRLIELDNDPSEAQLQAERLLRRASIPTNKQGKVPDYATLRQACGHLGATETRGSIAIFESPALGISMTRPVLGDKTESIRLLPRHDGMVTMFRLSQTDGKWERVGQLWNDDAYVYAKAFLTAPPARPLRMTSPEDRERIVGPLQVDRDWRPSAELSRQGNSGRQHVAMP